jgi:hypothetical protein
MKPIFSFMLLMLISTASLFSQTIVTGVYVDSATVEGIPYATVALFKDGSTQPEVVTLTTLNGSFEAKTKSNGNYRMTITNMGNKPVSEPFVADGKKHDFGNIIALPMSEKLEELTVVAAKPIIKSEVDRISYDVEADPEAPAKTALDLLRKMPLITVDGEDNIKLNGSTSFQIHVNGKPSTLFENEPGKTLKGIPATAIKNVEVITAPGAKYDAEGVGGIINIVMSQGSNLDGYTATLSLNAETPLVLNGSVNFMLKKDKFTASGRLFYNEQFQFDSDLGYKFEFAPYDGKNMTIMDSPQTQKERFGLANIDLTYEFDTLHLLNVAWNYRNGSSNISLKDAFAKQIRNGQEDFTLNINNESVWLWSGNEFNVNYEHKLNNDHILTLSFKSFTSPNGGSESNMKYSNWNINQPVPLNYYDTDSENDEKRGETVGQLDYVGKINDNHSLEAGVKYTHRFNDSESYTVYSRDYEPILLDSVVNSSLEHRQGILAAYASYTLKANKFSSKLGMRLENSTLDATSIYNDEVTTFDYNHLDFVPSLYLAYNLSHTNSVKLAYNMRIMRPGISYLNPYRFEQSPFEINYGNIELESEYHHSVSASFSSFAQLFMLNTSFTYNYCGNDIVNYRFLNNSVLESTYGNYGKQNSFRWNVYTNVTFSKSTSLSFNGDLGYVHLKSTKSDIEAKGFEPNFYMGLNQDLPWEIQSSFYVGYNSKRVQLQSEGFDFYYYGLTINRSFVKDRLTFSVDANNFLKPMLKLHQEQLSEGARSVQDIEYPIGRVRVGISYRIGELKASKRTVRSIESDDLMSETNQSVSM